MVHEVVVVGGGIGGLTVAALLAARGVDVCLLERASQVGGVIARVESFGYTFDPGVGIYPCWEQGEIHHRVFSELPVSPPPTQLDSPVYVVRSPEHLDVSVTANDDEFYEALASAFPKSADKAIQFYKQCDLLTEAVRSDNVKGPSQTVASHFTGTCDSFRHFIDAQLQLLTQCSSHTCDLALGALALTIPRRGNFSIEGGASALADKLAAAIKKSGGRIRLDTPVLRLSYDTSGRAIGIDLLTGETVGASRAIISNLTVWDTFGKLFGLNRTPPKIRKTLGGLKAWGAYSLYLGIADAAASTLPANRVLAVSANSTEFDPESLFVFSAAPSWDHRAPPERRAVTVLTFTDVEEWFTFHENLDQLEELDQDRIAKVWGRLYEALPHLGEDVEVIETSNPFTCYDVTRRKLGMIGLPSPVSSISSRSSTPLANVHMIGDTVSAGLGIAGVTAAALRLADKLTKT